MIDPVRNLNSPTPPPPSGYRARPDSEPPAGAPEPPRVGRYGAGSLSFEPPARWSNATVFTARSSAAGLGVLLRMAYEPTRPKETLRSFADRLLIAIAREAADVSILESTTSEVAGATAIVLRLRFRGPPGVVEQHIVMLDPSTDPEGRVPTFNVVGPPEQSAAMRDALDQLLRTVRVEARATGRGLSDLPFSKSGRTSVPSVASMRPRRTEDMAPFAVPMPGHRLEP